MIKVIIIIICALWSAGETGYSFSRSRRIYFKLFLAVATKRIAYVLSPTDLTTLNDEYMTPNSVFTYRVTEAGPSLCGPQGRVPWLRLCK